MAKEIISQQPDDASEYATAEQRRELAWQVQSEIRGLAAIAMEGMDQRTGDDSREREAGVRGALGRIYQLADLLYALAIDEDRLELKDLETMRHEIQRG